MVAKTVLPWLDAIDALLDLDDDHESRGQVVKLAVLSLRSDAKTWWQSILRREGRQALLNDWTSFRSKLASLLGSAPPRLA